MAAAVAICCELVALPTKCRFPTAVDPCLSWAGLDHPGAQGNRIRITEKLPARCLVGSTKLTWSLKSRGASSTPSTSTFSTRYPNSEFNVARRQPSM